MYIWLLHRDPSIQVAERNWLTLRNDTALLGYALVSLTTSLLFSALLTLINDASKLVQLIPATESIKTAYLSPNKPSPEDSTVL